MKYFDWMNIFFFFFLRGSGVRYLNVHVAGSIIFVLVIKLGRNTKRMKLEKSAFKMYKNYVPVFFW